VVYNCALFQLVSVVLLIYYGPAQSKIPNFCILVVNFLPIIPTGEPTHLASKESNDVVYFNYIHYHLKSKVSARFNPLHNTIIKNCLKSTSVIIKVARKIQRISIMQTEALMCYHHKANGGHLRMHCMYCSTMHSSWTEGTSRAEVMLLNQAYSLSHYQGTVVRRHHLVSQ